MADITNRDSQRIQLSKPVPSKKEPRKYNPDLNIWDPQEWETSKASHAFHNFILLGPKRTLDACAKSLGYPSRSSIEDWYSVNLWRERAQAWDTYLQIIIRKSQEDQIVEMNKRQAEMFKRFQEIASDKMELLAVEEKLPPWDHAVKLASESAKGERVARGTPDTLPAKSTFNGQTNVNITNTTMSAGFNFEVLSDTELDNMLVMLEKIGADSEALKGIGIGAKTDPDPDIIDHV